MNTSSALGTLAFGTRPAARPPSRSAASAGIKDGVALSGDCGSVAATPRLSVATVVVAGVSATDRAGARLGVRVRSIQIDKDTFSSCPA